MGLSVCACCVYSLSDEVQCDLGGEVQVLRGRAKKYRRDGDMLHRPRILDYPRVLAKGGCTARLMRAEPPAEVDVEALLCACDRRRVRRIAGGVSRVTKRQTR